MSAPAITRKPKTSVDFFKEAFEGDYDVSVDGDNNIAISSKTKADEIVKMNHHWYQWVVNRTKLMLSSDKKGITTEEFDKQIVDLLKELPSKLGEFRKLSDFFQLLNSGRIRNLKKFTRAQYEAVIEEAKTPKKITYTAARYFQEVFGAAFSRIDEGSFYIENEGDEDGKGEGILIMVNYASNTVGLLRKKIGAEKKIDAKEVAPEDVVKGLKTLYEEAGSLEYFLNFCRTLSTKKASDDIDPNSLYEATMKAAKNKKICHYFVNDCFKEVFKDSVFELGGVNKVTFSMKKDGKDDSIEKVEMPIGRVLALVRAIKIKLGISEKNIDEENFHKIASEMRRVCEELEYSSDKFVKFAGECNLQLFIRDQSEKDLVPKKYDEILNLVKSMNHKDLAKEKKRRAWTSTVHLSDTETEIEEKKPMKRRRGRRQPVTPDLESLCDDTNYDLDNIDCSEFDLAKYSAAYLQSLPTSDPLPKPSISEDWPLQKPAGTDFNDLDWDVFLSGYSFPVGDEIVDPADIEKALDKAKLDGAKAPSSSAEPLSCSKVNSAERSLMQTRG